MAADDSHAELGALLQICFERSGRNFEAVGKALHVSDTTVKRWLNGDVIPSESSCLRIARLLRRLGMNISTAMIFALAGHDPDLIGDGLEPEQVMAEMSELEQAIALDRLASKIERLAEEARTIGARKTPASSDPPRRQPDRSQASAAPSDRPPDRPRTSRRRRSSTHEGGVAVADDPA